jgi:hypothetical protein
VALPANARCPFGERLAALRVTLQNVGSRSYRRSGRSCAGAAEHGAPRSSGEGSIPAITLLSQLATASRLLLPAQRAVAQRLSGVPSMFDGLGVKVPCPT